MQSVLLDMAFDVKVGCFFILQQAGYFCSLLNSYYVLFIIVLYTLFPIPYFLSPNY